MTDDEAAQKLLAEIDLRDALRWRWCMNHGVMTVEIQELVDEGLAEDAAKI